MGNFYVNFSVKGAEQGQVVAVFEGACRRSIVTPSREGYVVAFDEEADSQDIESILEVGALLSRELGLATLAVVNHDDDILAYWLFERGESVDSYNSNPDYFGAEPEDEDNGAPPSRGGDAMKLVALLSPGADVAAVEAILRGDSVFAVEQHEQLVEALGLPAWSVWLGYKYVADGQVEDETDVDQFIHVGETGS